MWKRRLKNKIKVLRKDLSQLEALKDKDISNFRHWERLETKYSIRVKRLNVVIEELQERIDDNTCSIDVSVLFCRGWEPETSLFVPGTSYL